MKKILIIFTSMLLLFLVSCSNNQIEADYDNSLFKSELIAVVDESNLIGFVNNKGKEVFEPQFNYIDNVNFDDLGNLLVNKGEYKQLINVDGSFIYDGTEGFEIKSYYRGYISYYIEDSGKTGIKDLKDNTLFETADYDTLHIQGDNFVVTKSTNQGFGAINYEGEILVQNTYKSINPLRVYNRTSDNQVFLLENRDGVMLVDSKGAFLLDECFDEYSANMNSNYITLENDNLYYLFNLETRSLSEFFSVVQFMVHDNETTFSVDSEGTVSFINTNGEHLFTLDEKFNYALMHHYRYNNLGYFISYFEENTKGYDSEGNLIAESTDTKDLISINDLYVLFKSGDKYIVEDRNGDLIVENQDVIFLNQDTNIYLALEDTEIVMYNFDGKELNRSSYNSRLYSWFGFFKFFDEGDDSKYYICNSKGKRINNEYYTSGDEGFPYSRFYADGYIIAHKDGLYGVINKDGDEVVPFKYKKITENFYFL